MAYDSHNLAHSLKGQVIIKQASLTAHTSQIFKTLAPSQMPKGTLTSSIGDLRGQKN